MTDTLIKVLAFALLLGFLGILLIWVPRLDLGAVIVFTLLLVAVDFFWKREKR